MNFIEKLLSVIVGVGQLIVDGFTNFLSFLEKPLSYVFYFFDGVFYFIMQLFDVVVKVVMIFVALFQFIAALIAGVFRTLQGLLSPTFNQPINMPSTTSQGVDVVLDLVDPMGVLDIVPYICVAFVWFFFILKILALFGGNVVAKGGS
ncbi:MULTISPECIES: hypothetical protein [unclassified Exiguobacterium]|uniref:hypothetical protein n=1 Tax=unclassified Exiguobacterium TaxID=2644629 RepID=UPI001BECB86A|nr:MULTISPECIES: hypothetical protein [unclassified Exiguobacterium]